MDLLVVFRDRLDIGVPTVFSLNLFNSFSLVLVIHALKSGSKGIISTLRETS